MKNKRLEFGIDGKKKSDRVLTNLIIKHKSWEILRDEIIALSNSEIFEIEKRYKIKHEK